MVAQTIDAYVEKIAFQAGGELCLESNSILVIVGPNNVGKSVALSEIKGLISKEAHLTNVIESISVCRVTNFDGILRFYQDYRYPDGRYRIPNFEFGEANLRSWWTGTKTTLGAISGEVMSELTTLSRLTDCTPPESLDFSKQKHTTHPFQAMYRDDALEAKASTAFRRAFNLDLIVHRASGRNVPVYLGQRPEFLNGEDRVSRTYLDRVEALLKLEEQGDGVKSYTSIICRVITENRAIQLIDEPEAFLHPPQARLVAETVADYSSHQVFLATHSRDILQGLLGSAAGRVSVVRLTRGTNGPGVACLENTAIVQLWKDPILRFSNILDGIFHHGVIVTEADSDCRFYEAIAAGLTPEDRLDIHYTYSGGKDRIPVVVSALMGLKVPVVSIVDFDALNNEQPLRRIVEAHVGTWQSIEEDWRIVKSAVEDKEVFSSGAKFKREVHALLESYGSQAAVPQETLRQIRKLTRNASPWDKVKDFGLGAIPPGPPTIAANKLFNTLAMIGIFVVPVGEMEGFCRSLSAHGPRWVEDVMKRDLGEDAELRPAREFMSRVNLYLAGRQ